MEETLELGGNIQLAGFGEIDRNSMIIVKKMVGNYARKFQDHCEAFEGLKITLKNVHKSEAHPGRFELHSKLLDKGKPYATEATDNNLFVTLDNTLKKLESSIAR